MTTIRIAHAEPRPGKLAGGGFDTRGYLIVLADDEKHRAVPVWITEAGDLAHLLGRPAGDVSTDSVPQELAARLLATALAAGHAEPAATLRAAQPGLRRGP